MDTTNVDAPPGLALLDDPRRNKSTAFTATQRPRHKLESLLPQAAETIERQKERMLLQGSVKNLGRCTASWIAGWPNRLSGTAALT